MYTVLLIQMYSSPNFYLVASVARANSPHPHKKQGWRRLVDNGEMEVVSNFNDDLSAASLFVGGIMMYSTYSERPQAHTYD
jgi:hypothetical protein